MLITHQQVGKRYINERNETIRKLNKMSLEIFYMIKYRQTRKCDCKISGDYATTERGLWSYCNLI